MGSPKFATEDLTLVTLLLMDGIHHDEMVKNGGGCRWIFRGPVVETIVREKLREYNDGECYVEAREFTRKLGSVRQEMYQFLNYRPPRVRRAS